VKAIKDDEGNEINGGDVVSFSYGIPPVGVKADVREDTNGKLFIEVRGNHNPTFYPLRKLVKENSVYKVSKVSK
jgi:hypothetical protein